MLLFLISKEERIITSFLFSSVTLSLHEVLWDFSWVISSELKIKEITVDFWDVLNDSEILIKYIVSELRKKTASVIENAYKSKFLFWNFWYKDYRNTFSKFLKCVVHLQFSVY